MFGAITAQAREPHWYVEGAVPDTLDGRFRMLATIAALVMVRLERLGAEGDRASVALTERFVEVMETEHRELGLGDPKLGRTVRTLVGALARRVEIWRSAVEGERDWAEAARDTLYTDHAPAPAVAHSAERLCRLWSGLEGSDLQRLEQGRLE